MMTTQRAGWQLTILWVLLVIVVAVAASALTWAQATDGRVVSGSDLGFRIESQRNGVPTGRFVVRINGVWVEVKESISAAKLTQ